MASSPHRAATAIARGTLRTYRGPSGSVGSFSLASRKLVLEYCDVWPSSQGTREYLESNAVPLARRYPSVEVVVRNTPRRHPLARCFYVNGREKTVSLRKLEAPDVAAHVSELLASSGDKVRPLKNRSVESGNPSVRGVWSQLHAPPRKI